MAFRFFKIPHVKSRLRLFFLFSLFSVALVCCSTNEGPVKLIFDTDIESDVDDTGAVALLHALANKKEVKILAMGVSAKHKWSALCLDALNTYYGQPDIPIGVVKGSGVEEGSKYAETIAKEFPHDLKSDFDAPDAAHLYRCVLADQSDKSVVFVTVGFLTNIRNLLLTQPDKCSPLTGKELVKKKVRTWVCMGGAFPNGREWNLFKDAAASLTAINEWPTPIIFAGSEIGAKILTGPGLKSTPEGHPVRRSYELYNGLRARPSWDQIAVLYAVRGLNGGLDDFWDLETKGYNHLHPDGSNEWRSVPDREHAYLIQKSDPAEAAKIIEELMVSPAAL